MPFTTAAAATTIASTAGFGFTITLGTVGLGTAAAGASWGTMAMQGLKFAGQAASAYGQYSQSRSTSAYGAYQQNVYNQEADRLLAQRELIDIGLGRDLYQFRKSFDREVRAPGFVKRIKQGVVPTSGTAVKVAIDNAREADEQIQWHRYNAGVKKRHLEDQASMSRWKGDLVRTMARNKSRSERRGAGLSLLTAVGGDFMANYG